MKKEGSLTVVGTGIRLIGQITLEARSYIQDAEKLLFLVSEPVIKVWIKRLNSTAESLEDCYAQGKPRAESYKQMVDRILRYVRMPQNVCAVFYGHPGVFVQPSHEAIRLAQQEGFSARMLPAVSAEDCLFADLGIDPGQRGCQSFEATDFLIRPRKFDTSSSLILWQIGVIGELSIRSTPNVRGLRVLVEVLKQHYCSDHEVVIYEAAHYPVCDPVIRRIRLADLPKCRFSLISTLYVPPESCAALDTRMLNRLGMLRA